MKKYFIIALIANSCSKDKSNERFCGTITQATTNGIVVNGRAIQLNNPIVLRPGSVIGYSGFKYSVGDEFCIQY